MLNYSSKFRFRLLQFLHQKAHLDQQTGDESRNYSFAMQVHKLLNQTINDQLYPPARAKNQVQEHASSPTELIKQIVENILQQSQTPADGPSAAPPVLIPFNRKLKFHISGGNSAQCSFLIFPKEKISVSFKFTQKEVQDAKL